MKFHLFAILILAIVMTALPIHLRFAHKNPTLAGTEPYYHARMSMQITNSIPQKDTAIVNGRPYVLNPYNLVLAAGYKIIGPLTFTLFPALFAIISFIFFWLILRQFAVPETTQLWILLVYALSPPLNAIGIIGTSHSFILALLMTGSWLLLTRAWIVGTIIFTIASLSGLIYTLSAFAYLVILLFALKRKSQPFIITLFLVGIVFIIGNYPPAISPERGLVQYLSDFGGAYGFSIFAFLLALVGTALLWEHKQKYYGAYLMFVVFLIASFFLPGLLVYANVMVSALAGVALSSLAQRKWKLAFLRQAALLVLFCGLLFSSISHAVSLADTPPTPAFFRALEFPPGTVLTHENYGFWVEMAGHKAIIDPLWKQLPEPEDQKWDVAALFSSTELGKTTLLLEKYNITHILITPEMQHGLLWEREQEGLDFLVENSETFKKLETGSNIKVWGIK